MMVRWTLSTALLTILSVFAVFSKASATARGYHLRPQFDLADCETFLLKQGAEGIRKKAQKWFSEMSPRTLTVGSLPIGQIGAYHPRDHSEWFAVFELPLDARDYEIERAYEAGKGHIEQINREPEGKRLVEGPQTLSPLEHVALGLPYRPDRTKADLQAFLRQPAPGVLRLSTLTTSGEVGEIDLNLADLRVGFHNHLMTWQFEELNFQRRLQHLPNEFTDLHPGGSLPLSKHRFLIDHGELIFLKNGTLPLAYTISREVLENSPHGAQNSFLTIKIYTTRPCKREPTEGELVLPQANQASRLCFTELPIVIFSNVDFKQAKGQDGFDLTDDDFM